MCTPYQNTRFSSKSQLSERKYAIRIKIQWLKGVNKSVKKTLKGVKNCYKYNSKVKNVLFSINFSINIRKGKMVKKRNSVEESNVVLNKKKEIRKRNIQSSNS